MKKEDLLRKKNVAYGRRGKKIVAGTVLDRECLTVAVTQKVPLARLAKEDVIPREVEGMETDVIVDEMPRTQRTRRYRPMPGGVSIGHPEITCGTGSPIMIDGVRYIISCAHVIANSNDCQIGDQTWQPGRADGGTALDTIGHLYRWVPIRWLDQESACPIARRFTKRVNGVLEFFGSDTRLCTRSTELNVVDAAISRAIVDEDLADKILGVGIPTGFTEFRLLEVVTKSGRTTNVQSGPVLDTDGFANVDFGRGRIAGFKDQIFSANISRAGDSGSLVLSVKEDNIDIGGMLFAGNQHLTIINKISNVLKALGLERNR